MKALSTLLKSYELNSDVQYFEMILNSIVNGQRTGAKNQFLELKKVDRKAFVKYITTCFEGGCKCLTQQEIHWFIDNI